MTKRPITVRRVTNAIRKAVREKGEDYVYEKVAIPQSIGGFSDGSDCAYAVYDLATEKPVAPSCIVGHVLVTLGVPLTRLSNMEGNNIYGIRGDLLALGFPEEVLPALAEAQIVQDEGGTWGDALATYEEALSK